MQSLSCPAIGMLLPSWHISSSDQPEDARLGEIDSSECGPAADWKQPLKLPFWPLLPIVARQLLHITLLDGYLCAIAGPLKLRETKMQAIGQEMA